MPEPGENETEQEFISRCIPIVLDDGTASDQDQAAAICYSMWREHEKSLPLDETVVYQGGAIKSLGDNRFGGYLVRFSTAEDPDLTGDFFTKKTDFDMEFPGKSTVYWNHGFGVQIGNTQAGAMKKLGQADLKYDETGVWAEIILQERDEYEKRIADLAKAGKLGWSSGTASHLVEREDAGKASWLKHWPLGLDASLTHTPAEPRNMVISLKSLLGVSKSKTEPEQRAEAAGAAQVAMEEVTTIKSNPIKESQMEMNKEELQELISTATANAAEEAIKAFVAAQPSETDGGIEVIGDEADRALEGNAFKSMGEFLFAVRDAANVPSQIDKRLLPLKTASGATGLAETQPTAGGFLVQPTFSAGLFERMNPTGSLLSLFSIDGIGPNSNSMVYNAEDETSRADGSRHGGVRGYWGAEAGSLTSSKPTFREVTLRLNKIHALIYATDELLEDASALDAYVNRVAPEELRFKVEDALINGDGVGKPLGILKSNALATPLRTNAATIILADVLAMWSRRWVGAQDYIWLIDPSCGPQLWAMTVGSYTAAFMPPAGVSGPMYGTLLGRPVIETEYQVPMTTTGDILLIAPSQYQLIDKGGVKAASSIHVSFLTDETAYRFTYRIDGQPMWNSALTPKSAGSTVSPFVSLATASA